MASYDKAKLLALMEQRRTAQLTLSDLSVRLREANTERDMARNKIQADSRNNPLPGGFLSRLLTLKTDEALNLSVDEVQSRTVGDVTYNTNINFYTYRQFILARDKAARLEEALGNAQKDFSDRFGIVSSLLAAVREWGFGDPELEM